MEENKMKKIFQMILVLAFVLVNCSLVSALLVGAFIGGAVGFMIFAILADKGQQ